MKNIIIVFIVIAFCSCKVYGQDSKKMTPIIEWKGIDSIYFEDNAPSNVGSYTVTVLPYMESTELIVAKARFKGVTIGIILFMILGLIAFISEKIKKKKEVITLPDEFTQNYKLYEKDNELS